MSTLDVDLRSRIASLLLLTMSCSGEPLLESNSGHGEDALKLRERGEHLATRMRSISRHSSLHSDPSLKKEILAMCLFADGDRAEQEMRQVLDSGFMLDELYPHEIAHNVSFVRCWDIVLLSGEVARFHKATRTWVRTGAVTTKSTP
jgi:hypothetical protein